MAGRGAQTFKKRQKEQQRREKQQEKFARRLQRKHEKAAADPSSPNDLANLQLDSERTEGQDSGPQHQIE